MREIKFDAIYKPTGEHFEPYKIDFRDKSTFGNFDGKQGDWCHFSLDGRYGDAILRQYTGLKDKNGKEIYVGDIYKTKHEIIKTGEIIESIEEVEDIRFDNVYYYDSVEVIGNIFQNPELMQSK